MARGQDYTTAIPTESGTVGNGWRDRETLAFLSILNGEQVLFSAETTAKSLKGSTASKAMRTMCRGIRTVRDHVVNFDLLNHSSGIVSCAEAAGAPELLALV